MFRIKCLFPKKWDARKITLYVKTEGKESELDIDLDLERFDLRTDIPNGGYAYKMFIDFGGNEQLMYDLENQFHVRNPMTMNHRDALVSAMTREYLEQKGVIVDELAVRDEYIEKLERMVYLAKHMAAFYAEADYSSTMESKKHIVRDCGLKAKEYLKTNSEFEQYDPHHLGLKNLNNREGSLK